MTDIPLGRADYSRRVAKEARIQTRNRYFESNPVLTGSTALIARPGLRRWLYVGDGPIRALFSSPGDFSNAAFTVSGSDWYRVNLDGTTAHITSGLNPNGRPKMAATAPIGTTPEMLYMADGRELYLYMENAFAFGAVSGSPTNTAQVQVDQVHYEFTNGAVDTGNPDGSAGSPYLVKLGATDALSWANFQSAVNANGVAGTDYSTTITAANATVKVQAALATGANLLATVVGSLGNGLPIAATGGLVTSGATLAGGGGPSVTNVPMPDDNGAIGVAFIAGYIVVIPVQTDGINGRFYWINPGETTIDPLNFATAERAPDPVTDVVVFGDQFWLPGTDTTEVWYFTGDLTAPVQRLQGVTFDRGTIAGTALQVKEAMIIVDSDGAVFMVGGDLKRISDPSIEERIRKAIEYQAFATPIVGV